MKITTKALIATATAAVTTGVTFFFTGKLCKKYLEESDKRFEEFQKKVDDILMDIQLQRILDHVEERHQNEDAEESVSDDLAPEEPVEEVVEAPKKKKGGKKKKIEKDIENEYDKALKDYIGPVKESKKEYVSPEVYETYGHYHEQYFTLFSDNVIADDDMVQIDKAFFGDDLEEHFGEYAPTDTVYILDHQTKERYVITADSRYYEDLMD